MVYEIRQRIDDMLALEIFPGAIFSYIDGGLSRHDGVGMMATKPSPLPLNLTASYDLASVSKVVGVGTLMMKLLHAGIFNLDDALQSHYSEWHEPTVSLRQLLTHTSGLDPFIPNRDQLDADQLRQAINHLRVDQDKTFHYTDVNFLLLGFMLEVHFGQTLADILDAHIFKPWGMLETGYQPLTPVVAPTFWHLEIGTVHDPKARLLGPHAGSAGLFSTLDDLDLFVRHYFEDADLAEATHNVAAGSKARAVAWDLIGPNQDWLLHTGYTGTFILINQRSKRGFVFLSNRVHLVDERAYWIEERNILIDIVIKVMSR
jgi:CubicO group peptidase (beta-lactamase class C family)